MRTILSLLFATLVCGNLQAGVILFEDFEDNDVTYTTTESEVNYPV